METRTPTIDPSYEEPDATQGFDSFNSKLEEEPENGYLEMIIFGEGSDRGNHATIISREKSDYSYLHMHDADKGTDDGYLETIISHERSNDDYLPMYGANEGSDEG